jgi:hypothetical protein
MQKKNGFFLILGGLAVLLSTTFCISTPRPTLSFLPEEMPQAKVGVAYDVEILVTGNSTPVFNYSISEGTLPPGLELVFDEQVHSARIKGTPTQAGKYPFAVSVMCYGTNVSGQTGEKKYTLVVEE